MLFDFATIPMRNRYKLLISTVVPRPIAWVVTQNLQGRLNAAPFSFFNAFSQDPPTVVIGIGGREPGDAKDTGNNIRAPANSWSTWSATTTCEEMNVTAIDFPHRDRRTRRGRAHHPAEREGQAAAHRREPGCAGMRPHHADRQSPSTAPWCSARCWPCTCATTACSTPSAPIDTPKLDLVGRMHGGGWYAAHHRTGGDAAHRR